VPFKLNQDRATISRASGTRWRTGASTTPAHMGRCSVKQANHRLIGRSPASASKRCPGLSPSLSWQSEPEQPHIRPAHMAAAPRSRLRRVGAQEGETILTKRLLRPCWRSVHPPGSVRTWSGSCRMRMQWS